MFLGGTPVLRYKMFIRNSQWKNLSTVTYKIIKLQEELT